LQNKTSLNVRIQIKILSHFLTQGTFKSFPHFDFGNEHFLLLITCNILRYKTSQAAWPISNFSVMPPQPYYHFTNTSAQPPASWPFLSTLTESLHHHHVKFQDMLIGATDYVLFNNKSYRCGRPVFRSA